MGYESVPDYNSLAQLLHSRAAAVRQPINGTFELTERCNLACGMCYIKKLPGCGVSMGKELTPEQWLSIARQGKEQGLLFLLLTGGEVFLYSRFFEVYEPLTRMGLMITLFTNGTLITENVADRLAAAPPSKTEITLYGATKETYDKVTGVDGGYEKCVQGIERLLERGIALSLKTTITRSNQHEYQAMVDMAAGWGLPFAASYLLSKRRDILKNDVATSRLSPEEVIAIEEKDRSRRGVDITPPALKSLPVVNLANGCCNSLDCDRLDPSEVPHIAKENAPQSLHSGVSECFGPTGPTSAASSCGDGTAVGDKNFFCNAGKAVFVVTADGSMNACVDLPKPSANILQVGFTNAWKAVQHFVDSAPGLSEDCQGCGVRENCPRCPAWSNLETGTLNGKVPYLCQIATATKQRFG